MVLLLEKIHGFLTSMSYTTLLDNFFGDKKLISSAELKYMIVTV